jgi:anti-sigma regulatory factor (Ser/Thr protein kinase)
MPKEEQLVIPSQYRAIRQACESVAQAAESAGLSVDAVFHVQLAVDEACTNVVEHAYEGDGQGEILISWSTECVDGMDYFTIRIEDRGKCFDPATVPPPTLSTDPEELQIGGLGIHFMRMMMDRVEYQFSPEKNVLTMYKRLVREGL